MLGSTTRVVSMIGRSKGSVYFRVHVMHKVNDAVVLQLSNYSQTLKSRIRRRIVLNSRVGSHHHNEVRVTH